MSWRNRLARFFEPIVIPHLARYLAIGQGILLLATTFRVIDIRQLVMIPELVVAGEWWRIATFFFVPPAVGSELGLLFAFFGLYLLYLYGTALEQIWGTVRFNGYVFLGAALTLGASFLTPFAAADNSFIYLSLFLAFAYLNPDFELYVFMILPIKIKWLAALAWAFQIGAFVTGTFSTRLAVAAAVGNFLFFFIGDIVRRFGGMTSELSRPKATKAAPSTSAYRHRCRVCQRTDATDPQLEFRYCSKCAGEACYCLDHLKTHEHIPPLPEEKR